MRQIEFYKKLHQTENSLLKFFYSLNAEKEIKEIAKRYNVESDVDYFVHNCRSIITSYINKNVMT